jgi:hypothetical protein
MQIRLTLLFAPLVLACTKSNPSAWHAVADSVAYVCTPVLVPGANSDGAIGAFEPGPGGLMAWTTDETTLMIGTSADQAITVGRKGEGPGEFAWVEQLGWAGDTLYATDLMLSRVQYFDRQGRLLLSRRLPAHGGWRLARDGRFVAIGSKSIGAGGWAVLQAVLDSIVPRVDTLFHFPGPEVATIHIPVGGGASLMTQNPFVPTAQAVAAADHSRFCGSEPLGGDEVRIRCIDNLGRLIRDTVLVLAPEVLTDAVWDRTIDRFARRAPGGHAAVAAVFDRPDALPRVMALGADVDGALWVMRSHNSDSVQRWLRLSSSGEVRDTLLLHGGYIARLSGDTLWRHRSDADGMQSVERCVTKER